MYVFERHDIVTRKTEDHLVERTFLAAMSFRTRHELPTSVALETFVNSITGILGS